MLNRIDPENSQPAQIRYMEADFQVLVPGTHVVCAITGTAIPLDELKYWSPVRQEAYVDAHAAVKAEQEAGNLS